MDDVIARRQHDVRGRAALLADQLEGAGIVGLVGEHPPHQPAVDDRQVLAVARRQRQHRLARRSRRPAAARPAARWRSTAARWWAGQWRGQARDRRRARRAAPGSSQVRRGVRHRGRRHRRRAVAENIWAEAEAGSSETSASGKRKRREKTSRPARAPPIPLPPEVMAMLFTENAANSSLRTASSGSAGRDGTGRNTQC